MLQFSNCFFLLNLYIIRNNQNFVQLEPHAPFLSTPKLPRSLVILACAIIRQLCCLKDATTERANFQVSEGVAELFIEKIVASLILPARPSSNHHLHVFTDKSKITKSFAVFHVHFYSLFVKLYFTFFSKKKGENLDKIFHFNVIIFICC